ncbi:MAG TPA: hypothetical protein VGG20_24830 [Thermoanaerobaculia bacterium]|jgi:hypothetical protein
MEALINLLHRLDDPMRGEAPAGFDRSDAIARFGEFAGGLAAAATVELASDTRIEDASFFAELGFGTGALRFSSFGNMIALTPDAEPPPSLLEHILKLAPRHGYVFVPANELEQPYTGSNPGVMGIRDWWIRYFDYL